MVVLLTLLALVVFGPYEVLRNTLVQNNEAVKSVRSQVNVVPERRAGQFPSPASPIQRQAPREALTRLQKK